MMNKRISDQWMLPGLVSPPVVYGEYSVVIFLVGDWSHGLLGHIVPSFAETLKRKKSKVRFSK